jgi:RimJ/RimL family protein N-acetyltransferase
MSIEIPDEETLPIRLATEIPDLRLQQMTTVADDAQYFEYQNRNRDHIAEFGNVIDESVAAVTDRRLGNGNGRFGIWYEGALIGMVSYSTKLNPLEAEIGVSVDKNSGSHGYATAAVKSLTDFAKIHFDRVFAEVDPKNIKSINLLARSGYQTNGVEVEREWGRALVYEAPE